MQNKRQVTTVTGLCIHAPSLANHTASELTGYVIKQDHAAATCCQDCLVLADKGAVATLHQVHSTCRWQHSNMGEALSSVGE